MENKKEFAFVIQTEKLDQSLDYKKVYDNTDFCINNDKLKEFGKEPAKSASRIMEI